MTLLTFVGMIVIPLVASPLVYLSGRIGTQETTLHRRSFLVRGLALLAILLAWIPFALSVQTFLSGEMQQFNIEAIWLRADGISLLAAAMILTLMGDSYGRQRQRVVPLRYDTRQTHNSPTAM